MVTDRNLLLTDAQALTASAVMTDSIALGKAGLDVGVGETLALVYQIDVAADYTSTNETYQFEVRTATNADGTTGAVTLLQTPAFAGNTLTKGKRIVLPIPAQSISATATHLAGYATLAGTTPTVTVTAFVTPLSMVQGDVYYASGFSVQA
jgi:hypothetical protein